jgi:hypothetical protein
MADIKVDKELEEAVKNAQSPEEIVILMHQAAVDQSLVPKETLGYRENWEPKAAETTPARKFHRRENIGGTDFDFTASSEEQLARDIANAREVADAVQPRDAQGRFISAQNQGRADEEAARKAELLADFRAGRISADQYVEESGLVGQYLADRGVPLEAIQETVAKNIEKSWEQASAEFAHSDVGADWPGGKKNLEVLGMTIVAMGLSETENKIGALKAAWEQMKRDGMIFTDDVSGRGSIGGTGGGSTGSVTEDDFKNAQTYEELHELARRANGQDPSDAAHSRAYVGR